MLGPNGVNVEKGNYTKVSYLKSLVVQKQESNIAK